MMYFLDSLLFHRRSLVRSLDSIFVILLAHTILSYLKSFW